MRVDPISKQIPVAVLGRGSGGHAMAYYLSSLGNKVKWWVSDSEDATTIADIGVVKASCALAGSTTNTSLAPLRTEARSSRTNSSGAEPKNAPIMGPSGSGKSTLLNIIGCLDRPSRGRYMLDGQHVGGLDEEQLSRTWLKRIGFIFQSFHLVPRLSAVANVNLDTNSGHRVLDLLEQLNQGGVIEIPITYHPISFGGMYF